MPAKCLREIRQHRTDRFRHSCNTPSAENRRPSVSSSSYTPKSLVLPPSEFSPFPKNRRALGSNTPSHESYGLHRFDSLGPYSQTLERSKVRVPRRQYFQNRK